MRRASALSFHGGPEFHPGVDPRLTRDGYVTQTFSGSQRYLGSSLRLGVLQVRHIAVDRALNVLGLDAGGTFAARDGNQHALHEVVVVLIAIGL